MVFLLQYLKTGIATRVTVEAASKRWIKRWKDWGRTPRTTPGKVYQAYVELSSLTLDQMKDEIDRLCWPAHSVK